MMNYPLDEGIEFRFVCPGCNSQHRTTVPRHDAPFLWRCKAKGCGWTLSIQTDVGGLSVGFTAPHRQKPELTLIEGAKP